MALAPITIKPVTGEAPSILKQAIEYYKPGGEFAGIRGEQLEQKRGTVTAAMEAQLVGRGLAGTTVGAAIPAAFEQQVATPWRTETEMFRGARLMEAVLGQAGFAERQTAREQEVAIANAQMELRERLANKQISAQQYNAAMARLAASGGSPSERFFARTAAESAAFGGEGVSDTGRVGAGGTGYVDQLLSSLEGDAGVGDGAPIPGTVTIGGEEYPMGATSGYEGVDWTKGIRGTHRAKGIFVGPGGRQTGLDPTTGRSLADIAEQWLSEPSAARGY